MNQVCKDFVSVTDSLFLIVLFLWNIPCLYISQNLPCLSSDLHQYYDSEYKMACSDNIVNLEFSLCIYSEFVLFEFKLSTPKYLVAT